MDNQNAQSEIKGMICPLCSEVCVAIHGYPINKINGRYTKVIHPQCMAKLGIKRFDLKKQGQIKHEPYEYLQELYNNGEKYDADKARNERLKYLRDDPEIVDPNQEIKDQLEEAGVSNLFGTKKEINHLHEYLDPQEKIVYAVSGGREGRSYLIVITNNRLMFINKNMFVGGDYEEIGFDYINAVSYSSKLLLSTIMITNGANTIAIENVDKHNAPIFVEKLKKAVKEKKAADNQQLFQAQQPVQSQPQTSNLGQIKELKELLDMGAITQEEFDLKKKELLGI